MTRQDASGPPPYRKAQSKHYMNTRRKHELQWLLAAVVRNMCCQQSNLYARPSVGDKLGEHPVSWSDAYISRLGLGRGTGGVDTGG